MNNYATDRKKIITDLENNYTNETDMFPEYVRTELISILAFAIKEADHNADIMSFSKAIQHITNQQGLMSHSSLNEQELYCVETFAQQVISQQEHIVFSLKNKLDTLRILDAQTSSLETEEKQERLSFPVGFNVGFVSIFIHVKSLLLRMVSMKSRRDHE